MLCFVHSWTTENSATILPCFMHRFLLRTYDTVFSGVDLVDWLVRKGVVKDREAGVQYGESLLVGRVVAHVSNEHYFHDEPYFYRFCD